LCPGEPRLCVVKRARISHAFRCGSPCASAAAAEKLTGMRPAAVNVQIRAAARELRKAAGAARAESHRARGLAARLLRLAGTTRPRAIPRRP